MPHILKLDTLVNAALALTLSLGCISLVEPSPYDCLFLLIASLAVITGLRITRVTFTLLLLETMYVIALGVALQPYLEDRPTPNNLTPTGYTIVSSYMFVSAFVYALIFSRNTKSRIRIALNAYALSCAITGVWDLLSYFNVGGIAAYEPIPLRVAGPFKDPNVSGSYCVLGAVYLLQRLLLDPPRHRVVKVFGLLLSLSAVFLSYSRGSWLAFIISAVFLLFVTYRTADNKIMKNRIISGVVLMIIATVLLALFLATNETIRETFLVRFQLVQDYDVGNGGRFGNQMNSISMLIERPLGFGPFRFPFFFPYNPHNSYIGAFSSAGWAGGLVFMILALITGKIAIGLCFKRSPFFRDAQVVSATILTVLLQAIQIDIDHWRFAFLMMGMVWGLESARVSSSAHPSTETVHPLGATPVSAN